MTTVPTPTPTVPFQVDSPIRFLSTCVVSILSAPRGSLENNSPNAWRGRVPHLFRLRHFPLSHETHDFQNHLSHDFRIVERRQLSEGIELRGL